MVLFHLQASWLVQKGTNILPQSQQILIPPPCQHFLFSLHTSSTGISVRPILCCLHNMCSCLFHCETSQNILACVSILLIIDERSFMMKLDFFKCMVSNQKMEIEFFRICDRPPRDPNFYLRLPFHNSRFSFLKLCKKIFCGFIFTLLKCLFNKKFMTHA